MPPKIRPYRPADMPAVYDICVRTADGGADARGTYSSDLLMGDIFAAPYATAEPRHTHLLDDGAGRPVGYILGTADTAAFVTWFRDTWLPVTAIRYPAPADPPVTADDPMLALLHRPERMLVAELADHPAHLHIDVLPEYQGHGWGRALMAAFLDGLRADGVERVHLGMLSSNGKARAFYDRLGFHEIPVPGETAPVTFLGRATTPLTA